MSVCARAARSHSSWAYNAHSSPKSSSFQRVIRESRWGARGPNTVPWWYLTVPGSRFPLPHSISSIIKALITSINNYSVIFIKEWCRHHVLGVVGWLGSSTVIAQSLLRRMLVNAGVCRNRVPSPKVRCSWAAQYYPSVISFVNPENWKTVADSQAREDTDRVVECVAHLRDRRGRRRGQRQLQLGKKVSSVQPD